jgi:hypothetical protein
VVTFSSPGIGTWEAADTTTAAYTVEVLLADAEGTFLGRLAVDGTHTVSDDGQTMRGEYAYDVLDPAGTVLFSAAGTEEGTRITIGSTMIASPEATPAT